MEGKYVQMTLNDWLALKGQLEAELRGAAAGFVRIGYLLRKIKETKGYENDGSKSLTEWAKDNYGLSESSVSRFMAINRKYSINGYSDQLRLEYAQYGSAKLSEMLTLPDSDLEMVSPQMKKKDIQEIKKFNKEAAKEEAKAEEHAADQHEEPLEEHHEEQAPPAAGGQKPEKNEHIPTQGEHIPEKTGKKEPEPGTNTIAPAQKETPPASVSNSENSDSAIAEEPAPETAEEPEQVEIDEILPAPVDSDPMRDLKDRFEAELSSLKVLLDCNNFSGMSQSIERLEHLRVRMAGLEALN